MRYEREENKKLVQFIFNENREVVVEQSNSNIKRLIRSYDLWASESEPEKTWYHYASDEQGSTIFITDKDKICNRYDYDAWGNLTTCEEIIPNRYLYTGQQFDQITQQYYLRARYYNPVIARFTQEDIYRGDGLNLYTYCDNNPVIYYDPSGYSCNPRLKDVYKKQSPILNRKEAFNEAKNRAGIPYSQQPTRQWVVGDDVTRKGYKNYEYNTNPTAHGRYYEYDTPLGKRVVAEHTNDTTKGLHMHAGQPKGKNPNIHTYDFKQERYAKIYGKDNDWHIYYK